MNNQAYMVPNPATPCHPIRIDPELCISCYRCADQCRMDLMARNSPCREGISPCETGCPAGENIRWTTYCIEKGRFEAALENIRMENPFPGTCGRVCYHPCEEKCARITLDQGVATNALERAAFDYASPQAVTPPQKLPPTGFRVAVIGSGPAGLTCAYFLALLGHGVTVFEAQPVAGGVPRLYIPEFRLPGGVVDREVRQITSLGVEVKLSTPIDSQAFSGLTQEYNACFVATGAPLSQRLGVPGEDRHGVISALDFLGRARTGSSVAVGKQVVVIGGGNVAVDSARLARRLGAGEVTLVCLESRDIMPAYAVEVQAAEAEGIRLLPGWGVKRIAGDSGKVTGIELKACTGVYDSDGRFNPRYDESVTRSVTADYVIAAIGQTTDLSFADAKMKAGSRLKVDLNTLATGVPGVYAGGDASSVNRSIVEAIASGKRAALSIDIYLGKGEKNAPALSVEGAVSMRSYLAGGSGIPAARIPEETESAYFGPGARQQPAALPPEQSIHSLDEVNKGLLREQAVAEAARCFRCSQYLPPIVLYPDECWFCGTCVEECPVPGAIRMEHPLNQRVGWKRKATGELFRIGMKNPPPPNTRPVIG